jgi:hypothetical protein
MVSPFRFYIVVGAQGHRRCLGHRAGVDFTMASNVLSHFVDNVLPSIADYEKAEDELSEAYRQSDGDATKWEWAGKTAKRKAADAAVAIDGLADRAAKAFGGTADAVRADVAVLCVVNGIARPGSIERLCAVANAYKHDGPLRSKHPIASDQDILSAGAGWGVDAYGSGKYGGVEVLATQRNGEVKKVMADLPYGVAGWLNYMATHGLVVPEPSYKICGIVVTP